MMGLKNTATLIILGLFTATCGGDSTPTGSLGGVATSGGSGGSSDGGGAPNDGAGTVASEPEGSFSRQPQAGGNFLSDFDTVVQNTFRSLPADQIPALTDPTMVGASEPGASYVTDDELVLGVVINGEARAYPHQIGWWHEIVNDVVGGHAVVVSLCPLTSTGMVFDGQAFGGRLTCGVSGFLFNNNLVMYDRRDPLSSATLYPQMMGVGVSGDRSGHVLTQMPVIETTWRYWQRLFPSSTVVSVFQDPNARFSSATNTIAPQNAESLYRDYPYEILNYRSPKSNPLIDSFPTLSRNPTAQIFENKDMVHGIRFGQIVKAYPFKLMGEEAVINDTVADNPIVVIFYEAEQLAISFFREFEGQTLTFEKVVSTDSLFPFMLKDLETGSTWDLLGRVVSGPNSGSQLKQVPANNAFWFAWATFWQNTGIL